MSQRLDIADATERMPALRAAPLDVQRPKHLRLRRRHDLLTRRY